MTLTTKERMLRMYNHQEADRIPIYDSPWNTTIEKWHQQGLPKGISYVDYFELDHIVNINVDNTPRFEEILIEENEKFKTYTIKMGATLKKFTHMTSTPEFVDFKVKSPEDWKKTKERMTFDTNRINLPYIKKNYKQWKKDGVWLELGGWFGFDITHSWMVGTERLLMAMITQPEWVIDMYETFLNLDLQLMDYLLDQGYEFDSLRWCDDMGYKNNQFFSMDMYRDILKPIHKKAIEYAHSKGLKAHLHSCGDVNPFIPELIDMGLDCLNPLEVKAGMDPINIKKKYGDKLVLHGGINAVLWDDQDAIIEQINEVIPVVMKNGGYIFASDHSIPDSVSFENMKSIIAKIKEVGSY